MPSKPTRILPRPTRLLGHLGLARLVLFWFDNRAENASEHQRDKTDWARTLPYIFIHLACLGVFLVGYSGVAIATALFLYVARMFAITGFYHRYFSHRTFKTSRAFQFVLAVAGNSAVQRGPLWWASHHRRHHLYSDQEPDVHSPVQRGLWESHVGWIFKEKNAHTQVETVPDLSKFRELVLLDRFDTVVPFLLATSLFGFGWGLNVLWPALQTSGWQMLVWGFFVSTVVLAHGTFTINSLSHRFGRRRFETTDDSRNNLFLALLTLGEGWHNNHHRYPTATRQGFRWYEVDITYYLLFSLSKLGLIWALKPVPKDLLQSSSSSELAA